MTHENAGLLKRSDRVFQLRFDVILDKSISKVDSKRVNGHPGANKEESCSGDRTRCMYTQQQQCP